MVSYSTLRQIALFGGVLALGGAAYFTEKIQENFRNEVYYKKSMSLLRRYRPAVEMFGEPIASKRLDLGDTSNNRVDGLNAKLLIPVKGPKNKGNLYVQASRATAKESWDIDQLDLEVTRTGSRWTFYKKPVDKSSS